jgi:hypothetical protein
MHFSWRLEKVIVFRFNELTLRDCGLDMRLAFSLRCRDLATEVAAGTEGIAIIPISSPRAARRFL